MVDKLSILREVGNIAAGHGAMALSEILGKRISLSVPSTDVIACQRLPDSVKLQKTGIGVYCKILVGLEGEVAFVLDQENIIKLIDMSYKFKNEDKRPGVMTEMGLSLIKEIGNVLIAAYLNALSLVLKRVIIPPIPTLISGPISEVLNIVISPYSGEEYSYLIETMFEDETGKIKGSFYMVLTPATAKDISETCRKQIGDTAIPEDEK
jgi:chemotaxis protein CheC